MSVRFKYYFFLTQFMVETKLSSRGQVVIPKQVRDRLNLRKGSRFKVEIKDRKILLKPIPKKELEMFSASEEKVERVLKESKRLEKEREKRLLKALA